MCVVSVEGSNWHGAHGCVVTSDATGDAGVPLPVTFHLSGEDPADNPSGSPQRYTHPAALGEGRDCVTLAPDTVTLLSTGTKYRFTHVLGPRASADDVHACACDGIETAVLSGVSGTVLVYGRPNSVRGHRMCVLATPRDLTVRSWNQGKASTLFGRQRRHVGGLVGRSASRLFDGIAALQTKRAFFVYVVCVSERDRERGGLTRHTGGTWRVQVCFVLRHQHERGCARFASTVEALQVGCLRWWGHVCGISVHFASFATTSELKFVATSNSDSGHSLTHNTTRKVVRSEAELRQVLDRAYITRRGLGTQYTKGDDLHVVYEVCPLPACTQPALDAAHSCVPQLCVESQALEDLAGCLPGTADPTKLASGMIMVDGTAAMLAEASAEDTAADNPSLLARLRFVELSSSRQALAAVGAVMTALTRRRQASHVPYRDSKLTRLLAPAFGACLSA